MATIRVSLVPDSESSVVVELEPVGPHPASIPQSRNIAVNSAKILFFIVLLLLVVFDL